MYFPDTAVVQVPGLACCINAEIPRHEVLADDILQSILLRFAQLLLVRSMHMAVCNVFHSVEQRGIRRLLTIGDLVDDGEIPLTHDQMATTLGVHRPTVTVVLRSLHRLDSSMKRGAASRSAIARGSKRRAANAMR